MDGTSPKDQQNQSAAISDGVHQLADAMGKIANKYTEQPSQNRFWKRKEFWSALVIAAGLAGYWVNWRQEIKNMQVRELQSQIEMIEKQSQVMLSETTKPRILLLNQYLDCPNVSKEKQLDNKKQRNQSLLGVITKSKWIDYEIDNAIKSNIKNIIGKVYSIDDICKINSEVTDEYLRSQSEFIGKVIGEKIRSLNQNISDIQNTIFFK